MDKLANQLREDAKRIDATISGELDDRIRASLHGVTPAVAERPAAKPRSFPFWWASSLTGVAAAIAVIVVMNLQTPRPDQVVIEPVPQALTLPRIDLNTQTAVLTSPLEQEIKDLQSDLKKAEQLVKEDMERLF